MLGGPALKGLAMLVVCVSTVIPVCAGLRLLNVRQLLFLLVITQVGRKAILLAAGSLHILTSLAVLIDRSKVALAVSLLSVRLVRLQPRL